MEFEHLHNLLFVKILVGGEVSVAGIQFLIVSLANVSLCLNTFYDIIFDSIIFVNCIERIKLN